MRRTNNASMPLSLAAAAAAAAMSSLTTNTMAQQQQCDISGQVQALASASEFQTVVNDSLWTPFQEQCANDIAFGGAYHLPSVQQACSLTPVSHRFTSLTMDVCNAPLADSSALANFDEMCTSTTTTTAAGVAGRTCQVQAVVAGQMSRALTTASTTSTTFSPPSYTFINIGCIPVCLPSDCSSSSVSDDEAVMNYVKESVILPLLQRQGFQVVDLQAIVPLVECFEDGIRFTDAGSSGSTSSSLLPTERFLSSELPRPGFYTVGSILSLTLGVLLVVAGFLYAVVPYFAKEKGGKVDDEVSNSKESIKQQHPEEDVEVGSETLATHAEIPSEGALPLKVVAAEEEDGRGLELAATTSNQSSARSSDTHGVR